MRPSLAERPSPTRWPGVARPWARPAWIGAVLLVAAVLIFVRLGHYAFWDDEAATALGAKSILLSGRNYALIDHGNIVAYEDGNALHGFNNQVEPLLPPYLTAASFALFGANTWSGRLPFALFGLGAYVLVMYWARRESWPMLLALGLGMLGSVSLILFVRNCRYYAPAIFFSVALAYLYRHRQPSARSVAAFAALSILLLFSHLLDYVAFYACLTLDYFFWQRKRAPLTWGQLWGLFLPQAAVMGVLFTLWSPLQTAHGGAMWQNSFADHLLLFYRQWRDATRSEFVSIPCLLLALGVGLKQHRPLLVRGCIAVTAYFAVINAISPVVIAIGDVADVRYLVPVVPLAVALEAAAICAVLPARIIPIIGGAVVVFGTNLVNGELLAYPAPRSSPISYLQELADPPPEPFTPTAAWINAHVPDGGSVWVLPNYAIYPLMFHAPRALYAWQFGWPPRPDYAKLPPIHFQGEIAPDYLVAFGPLRGTIRKSIDDLQRPDMHYALVATINVFWKELHRPELFLHTFEPVTRFSPDDEAVYIYQRIGPALPPGPPAD